MKVLLITNIYPKSKHDKSNSMAIHNLFKYWGNVEVIRPTFLPSGEGLREFLFSNKKKNSFNKERVNIYTRYVWKIPKTNVYFYNRIIKDRRKTDLPDVIIAHRLHAGLGAWKLSKKEKLPLIIGLHSSDINILKKKTRRWYNMLSFASLIACRSQNIKEDLLEIYPFLENKIFIAASGISKELIDIELTNSIIDFKNMKRKKIIKFVTVCRLIKLKNIDNNLKALSKLDKKYEWEYKIIGDGPEKNKLEKLSKDLNLDDKVEFLGFKNKSEVMELLDESHIFIMVSKPETFGLAYLEAMAKNCIVIGAKHNGIDGIVDNYKNGFLCEPNNEQELLNIIKEIFHMDVTNLSFILKNSSETIYNYTEELRSIVYKNKVENVIRGIN